MGEIGLLDAVNVRPYLACPGALERASATRSGSAMPVVLARGPRSIPYWKVTVGPGVVVETPCWRMVPLSAIWVSNRCAWTGCSQVSRLASYWNDHVWTSRHAEVGVSRTRAEML